MLGAAFGVPAFHGANLKFFCHKSKMITYYRILRHVGWTPYLKITISELASLTSQHRIYFTKKGNFLHFFLSRVSTWLEDIQLHRTRYFSYRFIRFCKREKGSSLQLFFLNQAKASVMEISFQGKTIIVTGAGRGIGREIAKKLAKCGAQVLALSKTNSNLESLQKEEPSIKTICVDITDWEATKEALKDLPPVHGLVNNAAIAILGSFLDVKADEFDEIFNTNVKSVVNVSQVVAKEMIARKEGGAIVNISSQASMAALQNHSLYCGTKGALDAISRVMALELGAHNIRVNCVNPTVVLTEMGRLGWSNPSKAQTMLRKIPLGRFAEVDEVVNAVLFLLSDKASMINGVALPVDGGFLAG